MPRYWLDRMIHVKQTAVLVNKAKFEWALMKRQEGVCWQLASLWDDPAWVSCHYLTAKSVCVEACSWSDLWGSRQIDRQADRQTVKQCEALRVDWLSWILLPCHIPPLLVLLLYLAMPLPLIDGLLVLLSVRKLTFVCLSVRELKEYALTAMCTKELHPCVCVSVCVSLC